MNRNAEFVIDPVRDHRGYRACEALQKAVWGFADVAVVPDHILHTIVEGGGLLLGAFDGVGPGREMIGFVLSLLGWADGRRLRHQSLMAAVRPDWQGRGVGVALKRAQREAVLAQGVSLITWTFDPLESRNAHFNLNKLGAVATRYLTDYYGEFRDARNQGLSSDRFLCKWHLEAVRTQSRLAGANPPDLPLGKMETVNRTTRLPSGLRAPAGFRADLTAPQLLLEIPADLQAMRRADMELARAWRSETRRALSIYFEDGYLATGLFHQGDRSFLVLERGEPARVVARP
ncbi:MAG: GNAT family N-acetyltransferase [Candidatus Bipolaricaulaceae bacterium]